MDSVDYYNKYASVYFENTVELTMEKTLKRFMELLEPGDTVLDLGCGSGRDGKVMLQEGLEVTLLDASEGMCELADIYTGIEPLCMDMRKMDFQEVFDGIWACACLLHLTKEEFTQVLDKVVMALKPEGVFYFSVKKGNFEGYRHERFFADYSIKEMKDILEQIPSFKIIDIWETGDVRAARSDKKWVNVLVRKRNDMKQV